MNKRISKIRSTLFLLLIIVGGFIISNVDNLRLQIVDYQLTERGLHKHAVLDTVNNVSREEPEPLIAELGWKHETPLLTSKQDPKQGHGDRGYPA